MFIFKRGSLHFETTEETGNVGWNHFEDTAVGAFNSLQEVTTHFTDVTLACGDGQVLFVPFVSTRFQYFKAHKLVGGSCNYFFKQNLSPLPCL